MQAALCCFLISACCADFESSRGCGKEIPLGLKEGHTGRLVGSFAGQDRSWHVHLPRRYHMSKPAPLVVALHGWGITGRDYEEESGLSIVSDRHGFVVVYPDGMADNPDSSNGWGSWNVAGTTISPGPEGTTCATWASNPANCYESCSCTDVPQCKWTTCINDITPSGVGSENITGFLPKLFEHVLNELCIDVNRQYATGTSNGGMAAYQLGVSVGVRLAAIAPVAGSFQRGFNQAPVLPVPVMDVHGTEDDEVPANVTMSSSGYFFTLNKDIFRGWRSANRCRNTEQLKLSHWPTPLDGVHDLFCISEGADCIAPVVRCAYKGIHGSFAGGGERNAELVWDFLSRFARGKSLERQPLNASVRIVACVALLVAGLSLLPFALRALRPLDSKPRCCCCLMRQRERLAVPLIRSPE